MPLQGNRQDQQAVAPPPDAGASSQQLPKGVVLDKDGKPCRTCTSVAAWTQMARKASSKSASPQTTSTPAHAVTQAPSEDCPADVERLGRSTWTLLHTMAATYPERPSPSEQQAASGFVGLLSRTYPCSVCAEDFRSWLSTPGNNPRVSSRAELGQWMCEAHNAVNEKLGKERFDCGRWEERWRTGPSDGRCG